MRPERVRAARHAAGLTQQQAARRLGVSQAYLALIEGGRRPVTARLAPAVARVYGLGPVALPLELESVVAWTSASLAAALGRLGYPGFRHLAGGRRRNPAIVLLAAILANDVEVRVIEALPWLAVEYSDLDWERLIREAKLRDAQNRLGFLVTLARQVADSRGRGTAAARLRQVEADLEPARLAREDTLCQASLTDAERSWLRQTRPPDAQHWNLLTDLDAASLPCTA